jgi:thioredoxin-like negative regulator of GroEL
MATSRTVTADNNRARGPSRREPPTLLFFKRRTSGPSRRMESLVAWIKVTHKRSLRVVEVDADSDRGLAERLRVSDVPSLVLVKESRVVGRLEGRATGDDIERMIAPHVDVPAGR